MAEILKIPKSLDSRVLLICGSSEKFYEIKKIFKLIILEALGKHAKYFREF